MNEAASSTAPDLLRLYQAGFPYAHGGPVASAVFRQTPEDFQVTEQLSFEPSGEGHHYFIYLEKRGENTEFIAKQLARFANVPKKEVGYAGLKDRHAVTRQWFSVLEPSSDGIDWDQFDLPNTRILDLRRHQKKLKKGALKGNFFRITLRDLDGELPLIEQRLSTIRTRGIPNYFGEQRFGHDGNNLVKAQGLLFNGYKVKDRHQRGLYLSAARSLMFNAILAARIEQENWDQVLPGDALMFADGHSFFAVDELKDDLVERIKSGELHPTGCLPGSGNSPLTGLAADIESSVLNVYPEIAQALAKFRVDAARRALRVIPREFEWQFDGSSLELSFFLTPGTFATSLLREVFDLQSPHAVSSA